MSYVIYRDRYMGVMGIRYVGIYNVLSSLGLRRF